MANQKISELNSIGVGGLDDTDLIPIVDTTATETKHVPWGSLKIPPLIGAKVRHSVNSTGMDFTGTGTLFYDTEDYDTHGFHAAGATNYRLTIPPEFGGMYFDLSYATDINFTTANQWNQAVIWWRNAAGTQKLNYANNDEHGQTSSRLTLSALGVLVDSGDFFYTTFRTEADDSVDVSTFTEFSIRLVGQ